MRDLTARRTTWLDRARLLHTPQSSLRGGSAHVHGPGQLPSDRRRYSAPAWV